MTFSTREVADACGYAYSVGSPGALWTWQRVLDMGRPGSGARFRYTFRQALAIYVGSQFTKLAGRQTYSRSVNELGHVIARHIAGSASGPRWLFARLDGVLEAETPEEWLTAWRDADTPAGTLVDVEGCAFELARRLCQAREVTAA